MRNTLAWDALAARDLVALGTGRARRNTHRTSERYLTTVARVPPGLAEGISTAVRRSVAHPSGHFLYPPESLHVTTLNLDPIAERIGDAACLRSLADAVADCSPFTARLVGIGVSEATIFAKAEAGAGSLQPLRQALRSAAGLPVDTGMLATIRGDLGAANLLRFGEGPVWPAVRWAMRRRRLAMGEWRVDAIELVETDKTLSAAGTQVIASLPLGRR